MVIFEATKNGKILESVTTAGEPADFKENIELHFFMEEKQYQKIMTVANYYKMSVKDAIEIMLNADPESAIGATAVGL